MTFDAYQASSAQKRIFLASQLSGDSVLYNMPQAWIIEGELDVARLEEALKELVRRHEILKTSFRIHEGRVLQEVHREIEVKLDYKEIKGVSPEELLKQWVQPFNLGIVPLWRAGCVRIENGNHVLLLDIHHIIADGISLNVFIHDLMSLYANLELPPLEFQYVDFALWQNRMFDGEEFKKQEEFWLNLYEGDIPSLQLPTDFPRTETNENEGKTISFEIESEWAGKLNRLAIENNTTLHVVLMTLYTVLLSRYTGQEDIVVGIPTEGRTHKEFESLIGMFINTLALRNRPEEHLTFLEFLKTVTENTFLAYDNQDYPFEFLVEKLMPERYSNRNPLIDTMFVLQNFRYQVGLMGNLSISPVFAKADTAKFDLLFTAYEIDKRIMVDFNYRESLFREDTIQQMIRHYKNFIVCICENPFVSLYEIDFMDEEERERLLIEFNDTQSDFPGDKSISQLFEEQVEQSPETIAVVFQSRHISYRELNERANALALELQEKGAFPGYIIGIMLERSIEMIVGTLAILKTGSTYLPINIDYPQERIDYMLKDAGVSVSVVNVSEMPPAGRFLKKASQKLLLRQNENNYSTTRDLSQLTHTHTDTAYIIYTSGSTGKPKGVVVTHRNVIRLVKNTKFIDFRFGDRLLQTGALEFDASTFEIWGSLLNGLTLFISNKEDIINPVILKQIISRNDIRIMWLTSSLFNAISGIDVTVFNGLTHILVGGDVLSPRHINSVKKAFPGLKIINGYGPTENTTFSTTFPVDRLYEDRIPIGRPITNSTAYIVDRTNRLAPIGITGELWVGGEGVSLGYLNNPELTAEKFVSESVICASGMPLAGRFLKRVLHTPAPQKLLPGENKDNNLKSNTQNSKLAPFFSSASSVTSVAKLNTHTFYKTGDLARWLPDGNIEFIGRIDDQVKIRGFRIEPGEIEARLLSFEGVKEGAIFLREYQTGEKYICAYVVFRDGADMIAQLKEYMAGELPDYMLPSYFVSMDKIPLTANGKVDRKALPEPGTKDSEEYTGPQNRLEEILQGLWAGVLGIEKEGIGIDNSFFNLGGHSLKATLLASRIHKELDVKIPLSDLFKYSTIRTQAEYVKNQSHEKHVAVECVEEKEYYALSSAQKRLFVLHGMDEMGTGYNMPFISLLEGKIEPERISSVFRQLIERHESFRTSFQIVGGQPVQRIWNPADISFEIEYSETAEAKPEELIRAFIRPFDLSKAPLIRVHLLKRTAKEHLLMVDMHHIISDGSSTSVLIKDFMALSSENSLDGLRIHYRDYAGWKNSPQQREVTAKQEHFWLEEFAGELPVLELPTDFPRPDVHRFEGDSLSFEINQEDTEALTKLANTEGLTLYMVLVSIFSILFSRLGNQEDIIIGTPTAGRNHSDLDKIIGMFVNTLALRTFPTGTKTIHQFFMEIKERSLNAFENQDYQYDDLVEKVVTNRDISHNPLFDVVFVLQNMDIDRIEIPGLKLSPFEFKSKISKFDITFTASDISNKLVFFVEYCTKLFLHSTIERYIGYFKNIVSFIIRHSNEDLFLSSIEMISQEERERILFEFNNSKVDFSRDFTIVDLFDEQVKRTPHNIILNGFSQKETEEYRFQLTYKELDEQARRLAASLNEKGVESETVVGLQVKRSIEMIIGIMGILKAGGVYLPIDTNYPLERIDFMLKDAGVSVSVVSVCEMTPTATLFTQKRPGECKQRTQITDTAYIIYTSGTTGKPKGVMVEHEALVNLCSWHNRYYEVTPHDRATQIANSGFDASIWEIFPYLAAGASLHIIEEAIKPDSQALLDYFLIHCITIGFLPTQLCEQFMEDGKGCEGLALRILLTGGDKLNRFIPQSYKVFNNYGPTENTVVTTSFEVPSFLSNIPIGKPIDNVILYILDKYRMLQAVGVAGELVVSGSSLARGYLNRPEMTAEKFYAFDNLLSCKRNGDGALECRNVFKILTSSLPNFLTSFFSSVTSVSSVAKLYLTGDLTRWLPDGNIEFLGRIDAQVKIRGFRIELGEIENRLLSNENVKDAVVILREFKNKEKYLCAYVVLRTGPGSVEILKEYLATGLPSYMIPSQIIFMESLPVTINGKIDRKALPEPVLVTNEDAYTAPGNRVEEKILELWKEILGIEKVGVDDDFFSLGGNSLNAAVLVSKIHKELSVKIPLEKVFKNPTIRGLSRIILGASKESFHAIEPAEEREYYPASRAQQRFYFLNQFAPESTAFNMIQVLYPKIKLSKKKLEELFWKLIGRHESLRTSFMLMDGQLCQRVHPVEDIIFSVEYFDLGGNKSTESVRDIIKSFVRPFDIGTPPLMRVGLIVNTASKTIMLLDHHHIISDGTSNYRLAKEYLALSSGEELPPVRIQYRDFSEWQENEIAAGRMNEHGEYWGKTLSAPLPDMHLPSDFPGTTDRSFEGRVLNLTMDTQLSQRLFELIHRTQTTLYMAMLAFFNILLFKYTGQEDIIIASPASGRTHSDLDNIIGLIFESIMMRNFPYGEKKFMEFLEEVKQNTLEAYEHQVFPYDELLKKIGMKSNSTHNLLTNIGLNVENIFDPELRELMGSGETKYDPDIYNTSKMDLTIAVSETKGIVHISIEYSTRLFKPETIQRLSDHFFKIINEVLQNPDITLSEIDMITDEEKKKVIGYPYPCYSLSHPQKRIYFTEKIYPNTTCNTIAFTIRYDKILDPQLLQQAVNWVINKNDGLRLRIVEFDVQIGPAQYVSPFKPYTMDLFDFSDIPEESEERYSKWVESDSSKPFVFFKRDLFYFAYIKWNEMESGFYMKFNHHVADGWTVFLLAQKITKLYNKLEAGKIISKEPYVSYLRFMQEEKGYMSSAQAKLDREFWHKTLLPLPGEVDLSYLKKKNTSVEGKSKNLVVPGELRTRIHRFATENHVSIYKLFLSALSIYTWRVTATDDFVIGCANHNRVLEHHWKIAGMFFTTVPIRIRINHTTDYLSFLKKTGDNLNYILKNHRKYPYDTLFEELREKTGIDANYLLNINLVGHPNLPESPFSLTYHFAGHEPYPLSIHINPNNLDIEGILELEWIFQVQKYSEEEIERIHNGIINIMDDALSNPGKKIEELELISRKEREELLFIFNNTWNDFPNNTTILGLIENKVKQVPQKCAVLDEQQELSYSELDEKAEALALRLQETGAVPGSIIGIMTDRTVSIMIGVLAIMKTCSTFMPLDSSNPEHRIKRILDDSSASILLTRRHLEEKIPDNYNGTVVYIDEDQASTKRKKKSNTFNISLEEILSSPAYIIYTSGSTGIPRGVMVSHQNYLNAAFAWRKEYHLEEFGINLLQMANFSFDVFAGDIARAFPNGGKMIICPQDVRVDPSLLFDYITKYSITIFESTPALVFPFMQYVHESGLSMDTLKILIIGSDACPMEGFKEILERFGKKMRVLNSYGVTEATIDTLYYEGRIENLPQQGNVPVGKPMPNMTIYIINGFGMLQPVGIAGELCIGGEGVAIGYLNLPERTAEKFVNQGLFLKNNNNRLTAKYPMDPAKTFDNLINKASSPFIRSSLPTRGCASFFQESRDGGGNIYKTGDFARWLPDGNVEFIGRVDNQVKIRGYRIEPDEIRNRVLNIPSIQDAVVAPFETQSGEKYLCAYIIPVDKDKPLDIPAIKKALSVHLPDYMIPSFYTTIERIPLSPNGKVDRKALPAPEMTSGGAHAIRVLPRNRVEEVLAIIWSEILHIEKESITIDSNFFDMGGHSLKVVLMLSKVHRELSVKIPLEEVFKSPSIRGLAAYIEGANKSYFSPIEPIEEKEYYPLSPAQKRQYILYQLDPGNTHYNIPYVMELEGNFDIARMDSAFRILVRRHESFRTSFKEVNDVPVQCVHRDAPFVVEYFELTDTVNPQGQGAPFTVQTIIKNFIRPFKLSRAPLLRVGIIKTAEKKYILMMDMHHIISDGFSIQVLKREFMYFYLGKTLPPLRLQYKDFTCWQIREMKRWVFAKMEEYWLSRFEGEIPVLNLPTDFPASNIVSFKGNHHPFTLNEELTRKIRETHQRTGTTLYQFLLAVFNILLSRYSKQEDIVVGCPVSGRTHADLHPVIGMFVNTLPIRNQPGSQKTFKRFLDDVKQNTLDSYENQDYPFDELVIKLKLQGETRGNPLFNVVFVLNSIDDSDSMDSTIKASEVEFEKKASAFDLILQVFEKPETLQMSFEYRTSLFEHATVIKYAERFIEIVEQVIANVEIPIKDISISHGFAALEKNVFNEEEEFRF